MEKVNITRRVFLLAEPNSELLVTPFQYLVIKGRCTLLATQSGKKKVKLTRKTALTAYPGSTAFISDKQYKRVKGSCEIAPSTFTVTYRYQGAPADAPALPATASYEAGTRVYVAERPESPIGDYEFLYWMKDGSQVYSYFTMPEKNVTITGVWGVIPKYVVRFEASRAAGSSPEGFHMDTQVAPSDEPYYLPDPGSYEGYEFLYWTLEDDSYATHYNINDSVTLVGDTTFYAWWSEEGGKQYMVSFESSKAGGDAPEDFHMDSKEYPSDEPFYLPDPGSYQGYEFLYWTTEDDPSATHYQIDDSITLQGDTTFYAWWRSDK